MDEKSQQGYCQWSLWPKVCAPPTSIHLMDSSKATSRASKIDTELMSVPDLSLMQHAFSSATQESISALQESIEQNDMAYFYQHIFPKDKFKPSYLESLQSRIHSKLQSFDNRLQDAQENLGDSDVFEILVEKTVYLCRAAEKDQALTALRVIEEKAATAGTKMDIVFAAVRLGFLYHDHDLVRRNLEKAASYMEQGGDWDRKNRLKTYQAMQAITRRDFERATYLLCDTLSTFTYTELISYSSFVKYAIICGLLKLPRPDLKSKLIRSPEVLEVVQETPHLYDLALSLYECRYRDYFIHLAHVEGAIKGDHWMNPHYAFIVRELRLKAYAQLLESYSSVTLAAIAQAFGVTEEFIDKELYKWISNGRLNCVVDKISGTVETTHRPNTRNAQYQELIKAGDTLLNRLQKLGRVMNV